MRVNELSDLVGRPDVLLLGWDPGIGDAGLVRCSIDPTVSDAFIDDYRRFDEGNDDARFTPAGTLGVIVGGERRFYLVFEDPSDGYRSCLGGVLVSSEPANAIWFLEASPRPVDVIARDWMPYEYNDNGRRPADVIVFADKEWPARPRQIDFDGDIVQDEGGHVWLAVGTDNEDDYYPCFIAAWSAYDAGR